MVDDMKDSQELSATEAVAPVAAPEVETPGTPAAPPAAQSLPQSAEKPVKSKPKQIRARKAATPAIDAVAEQPPVAAPAAPKAAVAKQTRPVKTPAKAKAVRKTPATPPKPAAAAVAAPAAKPSPRRITAKPSAKPVSIAAAKAPVAQKKDMFAMTTPTEMTEKMQTAFKDAQEKAKAAFGDAGSFAKGNVEAMVESSKILATGLQEMTKGYVAETKSVVEAMTADVKELTSVKSPTEFFEKQSALMRKQFDALVATSSKNSEAMLKLANEAFQPISTRVSLAVEKIKHAA